MGCPKLRRAPTIRADAGRSDPVSLLLAFLLGACTGASSGGPRDAAPEASACPLVSSVAACEPAPASMCTDPVLGCAPDALPAGLACTGKAQCSMAIDPCPGWPRYAGTDRVDTYVCTCTSGRWTCVDCEPGASLCVESPDGSLYFEQGADAGPDAEGGADAEPDGVLPTDATGANETADADASSAAD